MIVSSKNINSKIKVDDNKNSILSNIKLNTKTKEK